MSCGAASCASLWLRSRRLPAASQRPGSRARTAAARAAARAASRRRRSARRAVSGRRWQRARQRPSWRQRAECRRSALHEEGAASALMRTHQSCTSTNMLAFLLASCPYASHAITWKLTFVWWRCQFRAAIQRNRCRSDAAQLGALHRGKQLVDENGCIAWRHVRGRVYCMRGMGRENPCKSKLKTGRLTLKTGGWEPRGDGWVWRGIRQGKLRRCGKTARGPPLHVQACRMGSTAHDVRSIAL